MTAHGRSYLPPRFVQRRGTRAARKAARAVLAVCVIAFFILFAWAVLLQALP